MKDIRAALSFASPLPPRETALLLAHVLGTAREWIIAHSDAEISPRQQARFEKLIDQAQSGTPLPYLIGHWEFFGLEFRVTPAVLIPRPETELLIEQALAVAGDTRDLSIADIGTGSGIIAVTLAAKLPRAQIVATDLSAEALVVAEANALAHRVADRITFIESDLFLSFKLQTPNSKLQRMSFDLICANLPYIPSADLDTLAVAKHEPRLALDGGPDGLSLIRRLLAHAPKVLAPEGTVLLEIEYRQGEAAAALAREAFPDARVEVHKDLAGLDRVVEIGVNG